MKIYIAFAGSMDYSIIEKYLNTLIKGCGAIYDTETRKFETLRLYDLYNHLVHIASLNSGILFSNSEISMVQSYLLKNYMEINTATGNNFYLVNNENELIALLASIKPKPNKFVFSNLNIEII